MSSVGYQVIARKWRPQKFDDLVGQDHVVRTLKNAINQNRIAHAYLFVGPRGTGKTTTARLFAKCLNCEGGPLTDPPADSEICQAIMNGSCMDVLEIDGASNNGVEQVRDLRDDAQYSPSQGRYKIYIIDEVHMLSTQAFNALLKILEEPPEHVKFVFATTEAHKVLPTIVSRCQRFDLKPIPEDLIKQRLAYICEQEGITAEDNALQAIARMADGGMRDSQSILDQMIAFSGSSVSEADVLQVYGLVGVEQTTELARAIASGDHGKILDLVDEFDSSGRDFHRALVDLQSRVRESLLSAVRAGGSDSSMGVPMTTESLTRLLDSLRESESGLKFGLNEKVNFEVALLKASEQCRARAIDGLIRELSGIAAGLPDDEKKKRLIPRSAPKPPVLATKEKAIEEVAAAKAPESKPTVESNESPFDPSEETIEEAPPSPEEMAVYLGEPEDPVRGEDAVISDDRPIPTLDEADKQIFPKTKALMEELFRARLNKVQRINTKKIR